MCTERDLWGRMHEDGEAWGSSWCHGLIRCQIHRRMFFHCGIILRSLTAGGRTHILFTQITEALDALEGMVRASRSLHVFWLDVINTKGRCHFLSGNKSTEKCRAIEPGDIVRVQIVYGNVVFLGKELWKTHIPKLRSGMCSCQYMQWVD